MLKNLNSALLGLKANQQAVDVEANNISNVNTVGFKSTRINFSDVVYQDGKIGSGSKAVNTLQNLSQGMIKQTKAVTDLAINGKGLFILSDGTSTNKFTRDGSFIFTNDGKLINKSGLKVQGWTTKCDDGTINIKTPVKDIEIKHEDTCKIKIEANLNNGKNTVGEKFSKISKLCSDDNAYKDKDGNNINLKDGQGISIKVKKNIEVLKGSIDSSKNYSLSPTTTLQDDVTTDVLKIQKNSIATLDVENLGFGDSDDEITIKNNNGDSISIKKSSIENGVKSYPGLNATVTYNHDTNKLMINTYEELLISLKDDKDTDITKGYAKTYDTSTTSTPDGKPVKIYNIYETMNKFKLDIDNFGNNNPLSADKIEVKDSNGNIIATIDKDTPTNSKFDNDKIIMTKVAEKITLEFLDVNRDLSVHIEEHIDETKPENLQPDDFTTNIYQGNGGDNTKYKYIGKTDPTSTAENKMFSIPQSTKSVDVTVDNMTSTDELYIYKQGKNYPNYLAKFINGVFEAGKDETYATFTLSSDKSKIEVRPASGTNMGSELYVSTRVTDLSKRAVIESEFLDKDFDWSSNGTTDPISGKTTYVIKDFNQNIAEDKELDLSGKTETLFTKVPNNIDSLDLTFYDFDVPNEKILVEDFTKSKTSPVGEYNPNNLITPLDTNYIDSWDYSNLVNNSGLGTIKFNNIKKDISINATGAYLKLKEATIITEPDVKLGALQITADFEFNTSTHKPMVASVDETNSSMDDRELNIKTTYQTDSNKIVNFTFEDALTCATGFKRVNENSYTFDSMNSLLHSIEDAFGKNSSNTANLDVDINDGKFTFTNEFGEDIDIDISDIGGNLSFSNHFTSLDKYLKNKESTQSDILYTDKVKVTTPINVYDSYGNHYPINIEFNKIDKNNWQFKAISDNGDKIGLSNSSSNTSIFEGGTIRFDDAGNYKSHTPTSLSFKPKSLSTYQEIFLDLSNINAKDNKSQIFDTFQNGYNFNDLTELNIDKDGIITAKSKEDGDTKKLAQIALALFNNEHGLSPIGENNFEATQYAGPLLIDKANGEHQSGEIISNSLEMSNVNLSESLVNLMVLQKSYEANAKAITTADDLLKTYLSIKKS